MELLNGPGKLSAFEQALVAPLYDVRIAKPATWQGIKQFVSLIVASAWNALERQERRGATNPSINSLSGFEYLSPKDKKGFRVIDKTTGNENDRGWRDVKSWPTRVDGMALGESFFLICFGPPVQ